MNDQQKIVEHLKCSRSPHYFIDTYCKIEEPKRDTTDWIPFRLWPFQADVLSDILNHNLVTILKARQLGLTWVVVGYALWLMLFEPGAVVLVFSAGDTEAINLLSRLRDMHANLPDFLQAKVTTDNDHALEFGLLGSRARAFASTKKAGRSFTATLAIMDEADWMIWFKAVMTAVKPTIDNGGQLIMLSTPDKEKPASPFKNIWKAGYDKLNNYRAVFLPWSVHPNRDEAWYQQQVADADHLDDVHQEYPATPAEALAGRASSARFQLEWLNQCRDILPAVDGVGPAISGLTVYEEPQPDKSYVVAVDTAEGDITSDPSPATVFCVETWEEVAHLWGRFEPSTLASYVVQIHEYYNNGVMCVERNNHGHAVILALKMAGKRPYIYKNPHDKKDGWLSNLKWKTLAMDNAAECMRDGSCTLRTEATLIELGGIQASTLAALEGETDDRAMSVVIGLAALRWPSIRKKLKRRQRSFSQVV